MNETPKRRGRPPKAMATGTDRLSVLTSRERALALKARARHRYTLDLPLDLYEQLLDQAESWDSPVPDVVRACIRKGLEHIRQFPTERVNPYVYGQLNPPTQADIDPLGTAWPPTGPAPGAWTPPPRPSVPYGFMPSSSTIDDLAVEEPQSFNVGNLPAQVRAAIAEAEHDA